MQVAPWLMTMTAMVGSITIIIIMRLFNTAAIGAIGTKIKVEAGFLSASNFPVFRT